MTLQARWLANCQQLGVVAEQALFKQLVQHYSQPTRHYHTLQHLHECFSYVDLVKEQADTPLAIEMALWFHDVIYNVAQQDNELRSAKWAVNCLQSLTVEQGFIDKVHQLIMITCHQTMPQTIDEKIMVDVDLAILGATPERFAEYEQQIRKEYSSVPYEVYKIKRRAILKAFIKRPVIYQTPTLFALLEQQARINLHNSI